MIQFATYDSGEKIGAGWHWRGRRHALRLGRTPLGLRNALLRALGFHIDWQDVRIWHSAGRRVEICFKWVGPRLDVTNLGNDDNALTLIVGLICCTLYIRLRIAHSWEMWENGLGFYCSDDALVLEWPWGGRHGHGRKLFLHYPWSFDFHQRWELVENDGWPRDAKFWIEMPRSMSHGTLATKHVYDFEYTLNSGEIQKRKATVYIDRMEWRRRWLRWAPLFNLVRECINVSFDGEVGERTGSWKGGVTGCGYEMLPGETAEQTLRRMERERKFT